MDIQAILAAFNAQVRRSSAADGTGASYEDAGPVIRRLARPGHDGSGIFWSELDSGSARSIIAAQRDFFAGRGERFEWKLFDYDQPANLAELLTEAGFVADEPESLMVAESAEIAAALGSARLPAGVRLERITDSAGVDTLIGVHERVFGHDDSALRESLLAQLATAPDRTDMILALAGTEAVCAARIEYVAGTDFAGLWGGGTVPGWRRRGIYRALVGYRARLAIQRRYRYLTVDASAESRPILERTGFRCAAVTTPYMWSPPPEMT
jgi:hypothetical protein